MSRDILRVDGVTTEVKKRLQASADRLYGSPSASLLVRALIAEHLSRSESARPPISPFDASETQRVEIRLPKSAHTRILEIAESRFSRPSYYLISVVLAHLAQPQLQGDEIETLRRSNYELSKIGTNLNQIARAFNVLVKMGEGGTPPEVGKRLAALRREITAHTSKVLRVLNAGTAVWEARSQRKSGSMRKNRSRSRQTDES
ncbi:plasmid mobilization relaxosome protein MobC [Variovorax sp. 770b2]|jgi:hypothetical protein|uniref:plasmid mobilization relaxosome protein MobC n=1 Tax=Variovorax sp. 770b2 TaxID=1566271 RepID=UPI0008E738D2|nr:plasmid mobilization relaxosome protein MobC [Variovorax sp. 770b2]SFQ40495.1 mobilisation protein (MobC) [Variovorax sp. 770b2]